MKSWTTTSALTIGVTILALSGFSCCTSPKKPADPATAPSPGEVLSQRGKATIKTADGRELRLDVEVASDERTRERGLMFRRSLPEMGGMIFLFPEASNHAFWMKNTVLPLDMIFIDSRGRIVGIVENAQPGSTQPRAVEAKSQQVLEVNGGFVARHGIAAGDLVQLEGMYDLR